MVLWVISLGRVPDGLGGFLTDTLLLIWVCMVPVPVNVPDASLEWSVLPGTGIVPSGAAVTLNVLVPVEN